MTKESSQAGEEHTLVLDRDTLVVRVVPRLGGDARVALPDLHLVAVAEVCSSKVSASEMIEGKKEERDVLSPASRQ